MDRAFTSAPGTKDRTSARTVERLHQTIQASRDHLRERGSEEGDLSIWFNQIATLRTETASAEEPEPEEEPQSRPLGLIATSIPNADVLETMATALNGLPAVTRASLTRFADEQAHFDIELHEPLAGDELVAALEASTELQVEIMETLPTKLRIRLLEAVAS